MPLESDSLVTFRGPTMDDVHDLHRMLIESTGGKSKITETHLSEALFGPFNVIEPEIVEDPEIEFDPKLAKSNKPLAQVLLADIGQQTVGYALYVYHYSPWTSNCIFIRDVYVKPAHRRQGIASKLLEKLSEIGKRESLKLTMLDVVRLDKNIVAKMESLGYKWLRNDDTDWTVCRIMFNEDLSKGQAGSRSILEL